MATRNVITSIQFKADAGKANAAIDSIRQSAKAASDKMKELEQLLAEGKKVNLPTEQIEKLQKELAAATKEFKQWDAAQKNLMRGVKALDQAIIEFNRGQGSVERMSAALSKAARNAAQLQQARSEKGSQTWHEMEALILALDKNLLKAKQDIDGLIESISRKESVSDSSLRNAASTLKELMDLTVRGSAEWIDYKQRLDAVNAATKDVADQERRLKGELVDANDARAMAVKLTEEGAKAAEQQRKQQEAVVKGTEQVIKDFRTIHKMQQEAADKTAEQVAELEKEALAQEKLVDGIEKQIAADTKSMQTAQQKAAEADKLAAKEEANAEAQKRKTQELAGEVQNLKTQISAVNAEPIKPKVDTAAIDETEEKLFKLRKDLVEANGRLTDFYKAQKILTEFSSKEDAKDFLSRDHLRKEDNNRFTLELSKKYKKYKDAKRLQAGVNADDELSSANLHLIAKGGFDIKDWAQPMRDAARKEFYSYAQLLGSGSLNDSKSILDELRLKLTNIQNAKAHYQELLKSGSTEYDSKGLKDVIKHLKGLEDEFNAVVEKAQTMYALLEKTNHAESYSWAEEYIKKNTEADLRARADRLRVEYEARQQATEATQQSVEADKQSAEAKKNLEQKQKDLEKQQGVQAQAEEKAAKAREKANNLADQAALSEQTLGSAIDSNTDKLGDEKQKQDSLNKSRDEGIVKMQLEQAAANETSEKIAEQYKIQEEAKQKMAQAQELSEESLREGIRLLEEQNKKLNENDAQWIENEKLIAEYSKRLDEIKQKSAELRGEVMSLADAEKIANAAMEEQAKTEKTGWAAANDELKKAEQVLADRVSKAKRGTKEEEAQYQKLVRQLQAVRTEMQGGAVTGEKMMEVLKDPKAYTNIDTLKGAISRARMELNALGERIDQAKMGKSNEDVRKLQKTYDDLAESVKGADIRMKELQNSAKGTASQFDKAWSRLKTYVGLYMGAAVAIQKLTGTMGDLMELSDKMGEVRKTTGFTADEVGRLSENLKELDVRTGLTSLMEVSASAGQLGLKTLEDVQGFTEAANKLMIALPEMGREAATEMMRVAIATGEVEKIRKQMQEGVIEGSSATAVAMEKIASTIDRLRASSASTAPEITDFVKRVGAVGAQSGITIDQVSALGSTISSLGMRVEMSATALSRMIPAIKNNAFDIARAIGVTPDTIRDLFDAGRGMEAILMILQHMKDANMDEESIEAMMGMGGMVDIMKDLNQQGARAGIVFAGLSQNVDELRRQLGVANKAYEENVAIQQEFDKMNETTAAKWERLKNQVEEAFVSDTAQRLLGDIIDGLRTIVDILTGKVGPALNFVIDMAKTFLVGWAVFRLGLGEGIFIQAAKSLRSFGDTLKLMGMYTKECIALKWQLIKATDEETKATLRAKLAQQGLSKAMSANIYMAVAAAIAYLTYRIVEYFNAATEAAAEAGRFNEKIAEEKKALDDLFAPLKRANTAQDERLRLINEINSKYSKYLGYMLSETSSAIQLANAHELIAKRIREEAYERRILEKEKAIREEHSEDVNAAYAKITERIRGAAIGKADVQDMADMLKGIVDANIENIKYAADNSGNIFSSRSRYFIDPKIKATIDNGIERLVVDGKLSRDYVSLIQKAVYKYTVEAKSQHDEIMAQTANVRSDLRNIQGAIKIDLANNLSNLVSNVISSANNIVREKQGPVSNYLTRPSGSNAPQVPSLFGGGSQQQSGTGWQAPWQQPQQQQQQASQIQAAPAGWTPKVSMKDVAAVRQFVQDQDALRSAVQSYQGAERAAAESWLVSKEELEKYRKVLEKADNLKNNNGGWGGKQDSDSTNYADMNAEQLVQRRKQMKDFVNAIQTDSDVKAVLAEDKALQKAIKEGMASDFRTVINWYNTERLKIQDELHARFLTNTGDWMDPKKQKGAHKQFKAELDAYLEELDAYYTERKTEIETARSNEEITEGEAWRRNLKNENEWYQRRAELLKLYAEKGAEVTEKEQDAIVKIIAERTGDSEEFVKAMIKKTIGFAKQIEQSGEKGAAMVHRWRADIDLNTEKALLKSQQAITKQVKFIEETLAKERPYDSITKNLQDNLDKMGVLAAKMRRVNDELKADGKEPKYSDEQMTAAMYKELSFYLEQAEDAYRIGIDELLRRMVEKGMEETAREIEKSDMLKQAVMGQLRKVYQEVQDAVKKEASQIKKDVEIMWNDDTLGPDGKSIKATFDKTIAQLGMQQDSVSRANSLIGAGAASDNVASHIVMKQIKVQMQMQELQFNMYRTQARQRMEALKAEAKEHERIAAAMTNEAEKQRELTAAANAMRDAENVRRSLGLTLAEETKKKEELNAELLKQQEEIQNRLYQSLKEWTDLFASSIQGVFEASHAGDAEYYNELAKLNLTGKGGSGAGTYVIIDNEGTSKARAHYEYLDEREALEREHEIERQNAQAEAWKKLWDDINNKMSEQITDWINAMLQNQSIDANTAKVSLNTDAININTEASRQSTEAMNNLKNQLSQGIRIDSSSSVPAAGIASAIGAGEAGQMSLPDTNTRESTNALPYQNAYLEHFLGIRKASDGTLKTVTDNDRKMAASAQSTFAKMTLAANMYGIAYQAMSNENLSATQKFEMMALQAVGNYAIGALTTEMASASAKAATDSPGVLGKLWKELGWAAAPVFAIFTGLLGGLMGLASSKIGKAKSQIAQATGASVGAGRLSTGMLTYAEGNVNEFTDPGSLTPGRSYNVDAADGRTYRAKYTGSNPGTHLTNGPEFHLAGEKGREMIIDAGTTRQITMNERDIWHAIKTLSSGGRMSRGAVRRGGMPAFADGNMDEFADYTEIAADGTVIGGMNSSQAAAFQQSLDRNNELLERALSEGIKGVFNVYGSDGLVASYDKGKKTLIRHDEKH